MKITLRSIVLAPVMLAALAFTANTAMAESNINVPFNFTVGGQKCPAGLYTVSKDSQDGSVRLVGPAHSFVWGAHPGDAKTDEKRVVLKFDGSGQDHVLRSIQYGPLVTSQLNKKTTNTEIRVTAAGQ
jgi:hypothetical protein